MPILIDPSATYSADDVFNPDKVNGVPRLPTEAWQYPIAQWANEVDASLISLNSWIQGDSPAGATLKNLRLIGGLLVAENVGIAGGDPADVVALKGIAIGSTSDFNTSVQIQTDNGGIASMFFSDLDSVSAGGVVYDHGVNNLIFAVDSSYIAYLAPTGLFPISNATFDLGGSPSPRWRTAYLANLDVLTSATFGAGSAQFSLEIDGGALGGQEPRVSLQKASVEIGSLNANVDGDIEIESTGGVVLEAAGALKLPRLTTVQRTALTDAVGLVVYDTTDNLVYWNNGAGWFVIASGVAGATEILQPFDANFPAGDGASLSTTAGTHPIILYPDLATKRAEWYAKLPESYTGGNVTIRMKWTGIVLDTNNVEWEFAFERLQAGELLSVTGLVSAGTFVLPGPDAAQKLLIDDKVFSNAQIDSAAAGDLIRISLARNGGSAADTYGNSIYLLTLELITT